MQKRNDLMRNLTIAAILIFSASIAAAQMAKEPWMDAMANSYKLKEMREKLEKLGKNLQNAQQSQKTGRPAVIADAEKVISEDEAPESEVSAAINPTDSNNIVVSPIRSGGYTESLTVPIYYTKNFGTTWRKSTFTPPTGREDVYVLGGGDPMIAFDANGVCYMSWIYLYATLSGFQIDSVYNAILYAKSDDGGANWYVVNNAVVGKMITGNKYTTSMNMDTFYDKQWMDCDHSNSANRNNLYISLVKMVTQPTSDAYIISSVKKAGVSAFDPTQRRVSGENFLTTQFASTAVDNVGNLHVGFYGVESSMTALYHSVSTDGGITFSTPNRVSYFSGVMQANTITGITSSRLYPSPYIVADKYSSAYGGNLYYVWSARGIASVTSTAMRVYFSRSTNGGESWSTAKQISPASAFSSDAFYPTVTVNPDGVVVVGFYDRTSDESNVNTNYCIMYSFDGGSTFDKPIVVSGESTDFSTIGSQNSNFGIGEYTQIVTSKGYAMPVWSDGRTNDGNMNIYTAKVPIAKQGNTSASEEIRVITGSTSISSIYPNPASENLHLTVTSATEASVSFRITNLLGETLIEPKEQFSVSAGDNSISLPIESLQPGTYFVSISKGGAFLQSMKFSVKK